MHLVLSVDEESRLEWIIGQPFEDDRLSKQSHLGDCVCSSDVILEFGPR